MKRVVIVAGSVLVTVGLAAVAFWLGSIGYDVRRFSEHEGRLRRLADKKPQEDLVLRAFADEGTRLVVGPKSGDDARRLAREHGGKRAAEIERQAGEAARTYVFVAGDVLYFVYFGADGVMRGATVVDAADGRSKGW